MPLIRLAIAIAVPQQNDEVGRGRISTGFAHQEIHDNAGNATDLPLGATGLGNEYIALAQAGQGSGVGLTGGKPIDNQPLRSNRPQLHLTANTLCDLWGNTPITM